MVVSGAEEEDGGSSSTTASSTNPIVVGESCPFGDESPPIVVLAKWARAPALELPLGSDFLEWKRQYWKERIGRIKRVVAPMVDQSELAFRMMMRAHGADLAYTPMIHASLFVSDATYRRKSFSTCSGDRPLIVQFCANEPSTLVAACRLVEGHCDGVDLNLGCPQLIAKRGRYGAYLQESPELIFSLVSAVYESCRLPISVKIRMLETEEQTLEYAKMIERAGASMLAVHGRKREQKGTATGLANWDIIRSVKSALKIPVIANGNIQKAGDVEMCLEATGADAVMSAEGILSNPMLFDGGQHPLSAEVAREYLHFAETYKAGVSAMRAHVFRICHYSLLKHPDLRQRNSYVYRVDHFKEVVDEIEARNSVEISDAAHQQVSNLPASHNSLTELVNSLPDWVCKPYIRPATRLLDTSEDPSDDYRRERRARIEELAEELSLSKKQVRKREHRRIELQKKMCRRQEYAKCSKCQQPAGTNCQNDSCRRCCKSKCIRGPFTCRVHRFNEESLLEKRTGHAHRTGITLEELLLPNRTHGESDQQQEKAK